MLIFLGETIAIYAEVQAAKNIGAAPTVYQYLPFFALITIGGLALVVGYVMGVAILKSIWVVSVASITSILISEPIINYLVFRQLPTLGAGAGFVLGAIGLVVALLF